MYLFKYVKPGSKAIEDIKLFREGCNNLAELIERIIPDGTQREIAITKLEEVSMWGNKGIVFHQTSE